MGRMGQGLRIRGADLSFVPDQERAGVRFSDGGREGRVEELLARRGASHVRLRVWVDPAIGSSDRSSVLAYASRCRRAGLGLVLCLHYSDTWADPRHQATPRRWAGMDLPGLESAVFTYTRDLMRAFAAQGTPVDVVQIGNEVSNGLLWPAGRIRPGEQPGDGFVRLIRAGVAGARAAAGASADVAVHLHEGGNAAGCRRIFDALARAGVEPDLLALSYYPFWSGPLEALRACVHDLADRYRTPVLIAETAYPWTLRDADQTPNVVRREEQLPDGSRYPPTPAGQAGFFEALRDLLLQVPAGRGAGFLAWEPAWLPGIAWQGGRGSPYANCTMFTTTGEALPALASLRPRGQPG